MTRGGYRNVVPSETGILDNVIPIRDVCGGKPIG